MVLLAHPRRSLLAAALVVALVITSVALVRFYQQAIAPGKLPEATVTHNIVAVPSVDVSDAAVSAVRTRFAAQLPVALAAVRNKLDTSLSPTPPERQALHEAISYALTAFLTADHTSYEAFMQRIGNPLDPTYTNLSDDKRARSFAHRMSAIRNGDVDPARLSIRWMVRAGQEVPDQTDAVQGPAVFLGERPDSADLVEIRVRTILQDYLGNTAPGSFGLVFLYLPERRTWQLFGQTYYDISPTFTPIFFPI